MVRAIAKASMHDWQRILRRELKKQQEIFDQDPWEDD